MIPAWSLGVILLGYVFGFPVPFNSTQNGSRQYEYETLPQLNDKVDNSTEPFMSNDTESNETEIPFHFQMMLPMENMSPLLDYDHAIPGSASLCYLPTCMNSNLGSALQKGDEIAGASTKDPHGIGRK
ncbi:uncharacterized protein zgc:193726 isoform X3 [Coregonus clupeaformis]|uniref:uncharacterized protein zgc:193726 isoform X3 n=1 Tax=Coregonus clupeaformis TaxID=59861 RepID=UPI001BE0E780|nr:uncharacterized protein zgc:193726 isoform X3 [Coregonus clupeaformis]